MTNALSDRVIQTKDSSIERDHAAPRVVIVGGGFGGLAAAKALRKTDARIVLMDRQNHHLFQPLLYQVATSVLSSGQIASPIRGLLSKQRNTTGILGEVSGVDTDRRCVFVDSPDRDGVALEYDYLILATGASHSYFGHDEFARFAPGLKTLADAVSIRNRILRAFEQAEARQGQHGSARQGLRGAAERPAASRRLSRLESVVDMNALRRRPPRPWDTGHAARRQKSLATVEGS